jgi:NAD-dependent dihydropyrimidine dehydrogenase PreA subunit
MEVCPQTGEGEEPVFEKGGDGKPVVANPENCIGCMSCVVYCRATAVELQGKESWGKLYPADEWSRRKADLTF